MTIMQIYKIKSRYHPKAVFIDCSKLVESLLLIRENWKKHSSCSPISPHQDKICESFPFLSKTKKTLIHVHFTVYHTHIFRKSSRCFMATENSQIFIIQTLIYYICHTLTHLKFLESAWTANTSFIFNLNSWGPCKK